MFWLKLGWISNNCPTWHDVGEKMSQMHIAFKAVTMRRLSVKKFTGKNMLSMTSTSWAVWLQDS